MYEQRKKLKESKKKQLIPPSMAKKVNNNRKIKHDLLGHTNGVLQRLIIDFGAIANVANTTAFEVAKANAVENLDDVAGLSKTSSATNKVTAIQDIFQLASNSAPTLHTRGEKPGPGERALSKDQYKSLISQYRSQGDALQLELDTIISQQDYVYRATTQRMVDIYRQNGTIGGRSGGTFMTTDEVGLNPKELMDRGQIFSHWGEPEVLLKIPTSSINSAIVPKPLGNTLSVGWEPFTDFYPAAGSGGIRQFMGTTNTWSDDWVIPLKQ